MSENKVESVNGWLAEHGDDTAGGPVALKCGGEVLRNFHCAVDGERDIDIQAERVRVYHKAGQAVFESECGFSAGHTLRQISRYAGNAVRITWDFNWKRGPVLEKSIVLGAGELAGAWKSVSIHRQDGTVSVEKLDFENRSWDRVPLALVFEREDGYQFQVSPGFDLWRWNNGLWMTAPADEDAEDAEPAEPVRSPATVSIMRTERGIAFEFTVARPMGAANIPQSGDYRFTMVLAWIGAGEGGFEGKGKSLGFAKAYLGGLKSLSNVEDEIVSLDFGKMPLCESAVRGPGGKSGCWESNKTIKGAKKCIRQIGSWRDHGTLILKGLTPAVCEDGGHCERRSSALHWDLTSILAFVAWSKNALGSGWNVVCADAGSLPAVRTISLPNGFAYGDVLEQD